jgi:hypothetical protein
MSSGDHPGLVEADFGNAALYGLSDAQIQKLQAVMNAGARLIHGSKRC